MSRVEWRWMGRGWSDTELLGRLGQATKLPHNYDVDEKEMTLENGWSQVESQAVIANDVPGPPREGDAFEQLKHAITRLGFSDPRIVRAHFDASTPLLGRPVMLELRPLGGLRYLCPVRIGAVRTERDERQSVFGFRFDTLVGHVECGREWFLLSKDHASGELRFHIKASWREGQFPNWWSALGFELVGRRYQRAWHHISHERLRQLLRKGLLANKPHPTELQEASLEVGRMPVQFYSQRGLGQKLAEVEHEVERVRRNRGVLSMGFGVLAGMRSMTAPALLGLHLAQRPSELPEGTPLPLASKWTAGALAVLATGEIIADKMSWMPARISPPALLGRVLVGALAGAVVSSPRQRLHVGHALLGATAAAVSAFAFYTLRRVATRKLGVSNGVAGLAEDALVAALGARLLTSMR